MDAHEKAFFLKNRDYQLRAFIHLPAQTNFSKGLIFCHPYGEEKQESYRVFVNLARQVARRGVAVLRFDLFGTGDSEGEWEEATVSHWLSDITAAIDWLRADGRLETLGLLGLRFGGTLASLVAENDNSIRFLVLLNPIVNVEAYIYDSLRSNLSTQMVLYKKIKLNREQLLSKLMEGERINLDGYLLTKEFYESAKQINLLRDIKNFRGKCLIVELSGEKSVKQNPELLSLHSVYLKNNSNATRISLSIHPFWNEPVKYYEDSPEALFKEILEWVQVV